MLAKIDVEKPANNVGISFLKQQTKDNKAYLVSLVFQKFPEAQREENR